MSEQYLADKNPSGRASVSPWKRGILFFQISGKLMPQYGTNVQCTVGVTIFQIKHKTTFLSIHRSLRSHCIIFKATVLLLDKLSLGGINPKEYIYPKKGKWVFCLVGCCCCCCFHLFLFHTCIRQMFQTFLRSCFKSWYYTSRKKGRSR